MRKTRNDRNMKRNQELIVFYLFPHTLRETSQKFLISFQRVHQILCEYNITRHGRYFKKLRINQNKNLSI
mgnify:FL=1